ncbi:O-antigen ligase family protein [Candidatus Saccharibacteria bacterium]|nr:O-antigen ligase family protein [Candidatus Saccharibacteria bacterium]
MKKLSKIYQGLIYVLPAVLFFSYYPLISFGANETMNFELSLPLIWLVVFDFVAVILIVWERKIKEIFKNYIYLLLPLFLTLSIFWSENKIRGILTVGIFWLIYFAGFSIYIFRNYLKNKKVKEIFWKSFFGSAIMICVWCLVQSLFDVFGVPRENSLMCLGCTYKMFGFPHPNGFAIEPQFMGNLLLAPIFMSIYFSMKNKKYLWLVFVFVATLFLTFSRGAIYAFGVALLFMTGYLWVKEKELIRKIIMVWGVAITAFLFTLNAQGIMAQVSPTNDTYWSGVSKVLNHLSLGIIDVKKANATEEAKFDGYVAESTDTRMKISRAALETWRKDFWTMMFGVGIGGAGEAMFKAGVMDSPKEIVQNQYIGLLLETGLIGIFLLILTLILVIKFIVRKCEFLPLATLGVSYGITLVFFSGLPNALQIYLLPVVLIVMFEYQSSSKRKKLVS